ncbi:hypothetical protein [Actinomadura atramentaria]|uniref:hypothetical protein n=1 Tax=Actinomadura atramentaria TaxID=1990 RepID=UPI00036FD009|nr:hypothetical protein [Actinomadura atramentaria]
MASFSHRTAAGYTASLLAALATAAVGLGFAVAMFPDGTKDLNAYRAAPACEPAQRHHADCRRTEELTVVKVKISHKRSENTTTTLTDATGGTWRSDYPNDGPVVASLDVGDEVVGTIWRGKLTELAAQGDTQRTADAPADMRARTLIMALILVPSGLVTAAACAWRLARVKDPKTPTPGMKATLYLGIALFVASLFCPLVLHGSQTERFWPVLAVWTPIAAIMTIVARTHVTAQHKKP